MAQELPLVSVVTPSLNQGAFIEETILSVKNQTYPRVEHIIVDGGSADNTLDIIKKYEGTYNMRWLSEPDQGQSDAINKGFKRASGEIVAWLNSDDFYELHAVETVVEVFVKHPGLSLVYGDCNYVYKTETGGKTVLYKAQKFNLKKLIRKGNYIAQPSAFFRKDILSKVSLLDLSLHYAMDYDLWIRIGQKGKALYIPQVLSNFRFSNISKSGSQEEEFGPEARRVSLKYSGIMMKKLLLFAKMKDSITQLIFKQKLSWKR